MRPVTPLPLDDAALGARLDAALLPPPTAAAPEGASDTVRERVLDEVRRDARTAAQAGNGARPTGGRRPAPWTQERHARRERRLAAAAVAGVLLLGAGVLPGAAAEAHAEQVLTLTAEGITFVDDLVPGPGQYLKVEYRMEQFSAARAGLDEPQPVAYGRDRYIPATPERLIVDVSVPTLMSDGTRHLGPSSGSPGDSMELHALPTTLGVATLDDVPRDRDALLRFFRDRYVGGSASRNENLFVQLTDTLRVPGLPADLRRGLVAALAKAPGVRIKEGVTLRDGRTGVAVSRGEPLRLGAIHEVVLDPATGQVIGERYLAGFSLGEFGITEPVDESRTRLSVVDEAPTPDVVYDADGNPVGPGRPAPADERRTP